MQQPTPMDEAALRRWAADYHGVCHAAGEPGYCRPSKANWSQEILSADDFAHMWESPAAAMAWISDEIKMSDEDGLQRGWNHLLVEPVREAVCCLLREGKAYIWDGHHRVAALIATGRPIPAIVGKPM